MSVKAGQYNIVIQRRADLVKAFVFKDSTGGPINFTDWAAYAQIWDKERTEKYADFEIEFTNRVLGELELTLDRSDTEELPCECFWDLILENPDGKREYYLEGMIFVSEGYTEPEA